MPYELEVGLLCEQFHCTPGQLGYDDQDPRVMRNTRTAVQIYHAATQRKGAKKKQEWDKENPGGARLLKWARMNSTTEVELQPGEVQVILPERPR